MRTFTTVLLVFTAAALAGDPFNGKSLDGWKFHKQGDAAPHWTVGDRKSVV